MRADDEEVFRQNMFKVLNARHDNHHNQYGGGDGGGGDGGGGDGGG